MKKACLIIALVLEVMACAGARVMQHFTSKKMGMMRWVNGVCNKWTKEVNLDTINTVLMIIVAVAVITLVFRALGRVKNRNGAFDGLMCTALTSSGIYIAYTIAYTRKLASAYYLVSPILLLGAAVSLICLFAAVVKNR